MNHRQWYVAGTRGNNKIDETLNRGPIRQKPGRKQKIFLLESEDSVRTEPDHSVVSKLPVVGGLLNNLQRFQKHKFSYKWIEIRNCYLCGDILSTYFLSNERALAMQHYARDSRNIRRFCFSLVPKLCVGHMSMNIFFAVICLSSPRCRPIRLGAAR